jgi:hypothetical protein
MALSSHDSSQGLSANVLNARAMGPHHLYFATILHNIKDCNLQYSVDSIKLCLAFASNVGKYSAIA